MPSSSGECRIIAETLASTYDMCGVPAPSADLLEWLKIIATVLTPTIAGAWVVLRYLRDQKNTTVSEHRTRLLEVRRPFATIQLNLFMEAGKVAGELAAFDKSNEGWQEDTEWKKAYTRFFQLFWAELSIVENEDIKRAMESFAGKLNEVLPTTAQ
jgi:hypothetical protein